MTEEGIGKRTVTYSAVPTPYRSVLFKSILWQLYLLGAVQTASYSTDIDGDGLPNDWELTYGFDWQSARGNNGTAGDPDSDGLTNAEEYAYGTNPVKVDTDSLPDG